jgi:hypothetical protein
MLLFIVCALAVCALSYLTMLAMQLIRIERSIEDASEEIEARVTAMLQGQKRPGSDN